MAKTIRMTVAQAIVKFLDNQYVSMDGEETKFVEGFFTIFGHGIAVGLGEALDTNPGNLRVLQGRNEQGMCHVATAYAKQNGIFGMNVYHIPFAPISLMILLVGILQIVLSCILSSNLKKETLVDRIRYQG